MLSTIDFGALTDARPIYRVPNQSESLIWSSAGLIRTIGPVVTYVTSLIFGLRKVERWRELTVDLVHPVDLMHV